MKSEKNEKYVFSNTALGTDSYVGECRDEPSRADDQLATEAGDDQLTDSGGCRLAVGGSPSHGRRYLPVYRQPAVSQARAMQQFEPRAQSKRDMQLPKYVRASASDVGRTASRPRHTASEQVRAGPAAP